MRFFLGLLAILIFVTGSIAGPVMAIRDPAQLPAVSLIPSEDRFRSAPFIESDRPYEPRRDDIMGDVTRAGDTWYDYQSNGCIGKMIAYDTDGGIHVTWMDGYDAENATRHQKYNFLEDIERPWLDEEGGVCDEGDRSGYGALTLSGEETQRCISFFHAQGGPYGDAVGWIASIDWDRGGCAFITTMLPVFPDARVLWPRGVTSPGGRIHIVGNDITEDRPGRIAYMLAYINDDDEIEAALEVPLEVGITNLNSYQIACSPAPVSNRAAIIWPNSRVGNPAPEDWAGLLAWQMNNDLWMAWTDDGEEWNFDDPLNITDCIMPDRLLDEPECYGDTLLPYVSYDLIFDDADNIHVVFEARGLWWDPNSDERPPLRVTGDGFLPGLTVDASYLFHWSEETGEFNVVADGWFWHYVIEDDTIRSHPIPGAWKSNVCYPSLAYGENGDLYCVYNYYPENDFNNIVGTSGMCNGDIAVTVSEDNGETWFEPTMIVQTNSHLAESGEADCEEYPTVAERVDDYLHIFWENDREAGTTVQYDNASNTLNPFFYQRVAVEDILREDILEDMPPFHAGDWEPPHVRGGSDWTPSGFRLTGAYPNPFNNSTAIEFDTRQVQEVRIEAYSISGQKVADIYSGEVFSGHHCVNWDASDLAAGVYLIRLSSGTSVATMKVALVR